MAQLSDLKPPMRILLMISQSLIVFSLLGGILLYGSGNWNWREAWLLVILYGICSAISGSLLVTKTPELMDARRKKQDGVKAWDKKLVLAYKVLFFPTFIIAALDERFQWSALPGWMSWLGMALILFFFIVITWAPLVNPHLETYIRIQNDRSHQVIDQGPYGIVRHPTYMALALFYLGLALALSSVWALIPAILAVGILAYRTQREDQVLESELDGYADYMQKTRFRWIPQIW